jgi:phosphatidylserine/phosphatidylglycerophosphate/cardiolipin synthase-like enzyme
MRVRVGLRLALMLAFVLPAHAEDQGVPVIAAQGSVQVAFPPWDDAESLLLDTLGRAQREILVQAYLLTSRPVAASLIAARQRGLAVSVLGDARQHAENPGSLLGTLADKGIPVWLETRYRHAHNKIMVIDDGTKDVVVVTGSYNFTRSAQRMNSENLFLIRGNPELARRFRLNWERHRNEASELRAAGTR